MQFHQLSLFAALVLASCGTTETEPVEVVEPTAQEPFVADSFADSVALAHGFDRWSSVERLDFDFVVAVQDTQRVERNWSWYPRTDSVVRSVDGTTMSFVRNTEFDSTELEADGQFINDSYWAMMPFYLVWSEDGYEPTVTRGVAAPISGESTTMLTVAYDGDGGYTPGDAYDLYIDDDYRIAEWVFRRGGGEEASMTTAWADYRDMNGLLLPSDHPSPGPVRISHPTMDVVMVD